MIGAVIIAQNNSSLDYIKFANFAAQRVKQFLDIPVSIITDNTEYLLNHYKDHCFDQVIELPFVKHQQERYYNDGALSKRKLSWKNGSRNNVYNLTPYDRTLVIDSDYIINSSSLNCALHNDHSFQLFRRTFDLAESRATSEYDKVSAYSVPLYWATVFIFNKDPINEAFFNLVEYIRLNWIYFRTLYNLSTETFRNDHAFSIAIHIMNGKTNGEFAVEFPRAMYFCSDKDLLIDIKDDQMRFLVQKKDHIGEYILTKTSGLDVHVLNKFSLDRFIDGGNGV
jgi:hypothetical protein